MARALGVDHPSVADALRRLAYVSGGWGLVNLAPVLPFDGGHALVALIDRALRQGAEDAVRRASAAVALVFAAGTLETHATWLALLCALVAPRNVRAFRPRESRQRETLAPVHLDAAFAAAERGESALTIEHCCTSSAARGAPRADATPCASSRMDMRRATHGNR